jgi:hypothetical protein
MIYGKTHKQWRAEESERISALIMGEPRFAWIPTRGYDGRRIWLQRFYRYHRGTTCLGNIALAGQYTDYPERDLEHVAFDTERLVEEYMYESLITTEGHCKKLLPIKKPSQPRTENQ